MTGNKEVKIQGIKERLQRSAHELSTIPERKWRLFYQQDINFLLQEINLQEPQEVQEKPKRKK